MIWLYAANSWASRSLGGCGRIGVASRANIWSGRQVFGGGAARSRAPPTIAGQRERQRAARRRRGAARADQHRQDASRDRTDALLQERLDRPAAAVARARGLWARRPEGRGGQGRARHGRGEDQAALAGLLDRDRGGHAARSRRRVCGDRRGAAFRRLRPRPHLHRSPAALARQERNAADRRRDARSGHSALHARRADFLAPAAVAAHPCRGEEDRAAAAAQRRRRLLGGRGLRHRRVDQAPAGRRGRRARRALPQDAQRASRALSERRGRLYRRDRRDRHGAQSRHRSDRLRLRP